MLVVRRIFACFASPQASHKLFGGEKPADSPTPRLTAEDYIEMYEKQRPGQGVEVRTFALSLKV